LKFISGDDEGWQGFESIKHAWKTAILNDWVVNFSTQKQADLAIIRATAHNNEK
jgi:hypothetical protein